MRDADPVRLACAAQALPHPSRRGRDRERGRLSVEDELAGRGLDVLYDDRDGGAGAKFKDAELIGCPVRVAVGRRGLADGVYEVTLRASGEEQQVPVEDAALRIAEIARTIT